MIQSTITHYFKKETQPMTQSTTTHYVKEEIDMDWDEADNCYGEAIDSNVQDVYNARVVLEKLPESLVRKYINKSAASQKPRPKLANECSRCKKGFINRDGLRTHKRHCGKEPNLQCAHCFYKTKHKRNLKSHLSRRHANGKNIHQNKRGKVGKFLKICQKCNKVSEPNFPTKCENCFSQLIFQCKKCARQFNTRSLAAYHWSTKCGVKGYYNCPKCDYKSALRSKVVKHMKRSHRNSESSQEFEKINWTNLSETAESKTYECPKCTKAMENPNSLSLHIRLCGGLKCVNHSDMKCKNSEDAHRNVDSDPIKCSSCGKQFDHFYSLNRHIRDCTNRQYMTKMTNDSDVEVVHGDKDVSVKSLILADERYTWYTKMIVRYCRKCDEDIAIEEKSWGISNKVSCRKCKTTLLFKCTKCLKEYTKYESMKYHLDTICNPKGEFKCTKCNYKSHKPAHVKKHYKLVHGNGNAVCEKCGSNFRNTVYLSKHLLRCGVEPKFQCEHCPFQSKMKINLRYHIFRDHMEPVVIDKSAALAMSQQRFSRSFLHLKAYCSKCKSKQGLGYRLKFCRNCKSKLYYVCKTCKKKYNVNDEEACYHVKHYLETIKFECERCGIGLISKNSLRSHIRDRCGAEATFKCKFCKYACKTKGNMTRHEKVKHPNKV